MTILSLDQEKAFDRMDWGFMLATLDLKMEFGPMFIKWVYRLYTRVFSTVKVSGCLSLFFSMSRGVRPGLPGFVALVVCAGF